MAVKVKKPCVKDVQIEKLSRILGVVDIYLTERGLGKDLADWLEEKNKEAALE